MTARSLGDASSITCGDVEALMTQSRTPESEGGLTYNEVTTLVTGVLIIIGTAVRSRTKLSIVERDLKGMNLPADKVQLISTILRNERLNLETAFRLARVRAPGLSSFRWRVDVAISTDQLSKVFKPTIIVELGVSDGKAVKTFEIPVDQFHNLRYNVAKVLRNMEEVERHPIMRLAFEVDKDKFDKEEA
jgi:hypothetical protein